MERLLFELLVAVQSKAFCIHMDYEIKIKVFSFFSLLIAFLELLIYRYTVIYSCFSGMMIKPYFDTTVCGFQSGFKMWFVIQSSRETIEDRYCSRSTVEDISHFT